MKLIEALEGPRGQGRRRLPAGRQDAPQGGPPGLPARVHLRHQERQAQASSRPCRRRRRSSRRPASSRSDCRRLKGVRGSGQPPHGGRPGPGSGPILRTEGLTMRFGGLTAVNNVNIAVARGEIRAIIGPNGAGKSTFFNCLTGVLAPTAGRIYLNGEDVAGLPPNEVSHKGLARSYQITNILPGATVLENVRIAAQSRRHAWNMVRNRYAFTDLMDKARAVLDSVGLGDKEDELAANLSHGAQRNLEIGIALATEPQLLCLDEPTAGMSVSETHATVELVRRIAKNLTIVIVEHDMEVVMGLATDHHRAALRRGPGRGHARRRSRPTRACRRSISRRDARPRQRPHLLRQVPHPPRGVDRGPARGGRRPAGTQRRRQEHDAQDRDGPGPPVGGQRRLRGAADRRHGAAPPGPPRHRLGAGGPPDLPPADGDGEPAHGARPAGSHRREAQADPRQGLRVVPGVSGAARPGRRHALGRRAADAGHRARHDARAQDHPPRRADGRPDAAHGRPDLARSSRCSTTRASPSCWSSRTCR